MCSSSPLGGSTGSQSKANASKAFSRRSLPSFKRSLSSTSGSAPPTLWSSSEVDHDSVLHLFEQVLVVDDVAEVLVLTVEPVSAADGLKQAMVLHRLVDVEVSAGR